MQKSQLERLIKGKEKYGKRWKLRKQNATVVNLVKTNNWTPLLTNINNIMSCKRSK